MTLIGRWISLALFTALVLLGLQLPAFVDNYGKALIAHQTEASRALSGFQNDADRFFGGNLNQLIQHYLKQQDNVVNQGGKNIQELQTRLHQLNQALLHFNQSRWQAYTQTFFQPISDIRNEVYNHFTPSAPLNLESLLVGFGLAFFCTSITQAFTALWRYRKKRKAQAATA